MANKPRKGNPFVKTILAAASGGAVPFLVNAVGDCGADPKALAVQAGLGASIAVASLFVEAPQGKPPGGQKPPGGD